MNAILLKSGKNYAVNLLDTDNGVIFRCKSAKSKLLAIDNLSSVQVAISDPANIVLVTSKTLKHSYQVKKDLKTIGATRKDVSMSDVDAIKLDIVTNIMNLVPLNF